MGKAIILAAGEQVRWGNPSPKQLSLVFNDEPIIKRIVRQVRQRMNNYPHIISHQKCFRTFSANYIYPSARRYICETLLSVEPIWGNDWTMVLLGDVVYTDYAINYIYDNRAKYDYHFYGTDSEIFSLTFTDNALVETAATDVIEDALSGNSRGKLWELYYCMSGFALADAKFGRMAGYPGGEDTEHYTRIFDGTRDFDTFEAYLKWTREELSCTNT